MVAYEGADYPFGLSAPSLPLADRRRPLYRRAFFVVLNKLGLAQPRRTPLVGALPSVTTSRLKVPRTHQSDHPTARLADNENRAVVMGGLVNLPLTHSDVGRNEIAPE
jgi:hypothetical protein